MIFLSECLYIINDIAIKLKFPKKLMLIKQTNQNSAMFVTISIF